MFSFDSHVRYSECDEKADLSVLGLVNYLQDCSTFDSEALGIGLDHARDHNYAWLLAAWQIQIEDLPHLADPIRVITWSPAVKRTRAERSFTICSPEGRPYVKADSIWFVIDPSAKVPIRVPQSQMVYLADRPRVDLPPTSRRLVVEGAYVQAAPTTVSELHLDTNHHMNNAFYIEIALEALRQTERVAGLPHRICVQYKTMALLGDQVVPRVHQDPADPTARVVDLVGPAGQSYAVIRFEGIRP